MKRIVGLSVGLSIGLVLLSFQPGAVFAANPDTGPGCGLGKLAWGDFKGQKQIAPQVMMATTNGPARPRLSKLYASLECLLTRN